MRYYLCPLADKFENTVCGTRSCTSFYLGTNIGRHYLVLATLCSAIQCHHSLVRNVTCRKETHGYCFRRAWEQDML